MAGYSFGACVAFEMGLQLEKASSSEGESAIESFVLLDGSHAYVAAHTNYYKAKLTPGNEAESETEVLSIFLMNFMNVDHAKVTEQLEFAEILNSENLNVKKDFLFPTPSIPQNQFAF